MPRSRFVPPAGALAVAVLTAGGLLVVTQLAGSPAGAATARPLFKAPFVCRTAWGASTYAGHGKAIDFNTMKGADTDLGKPVLASAAGRAKRGYDSGHGNYVVIDHGRGWSTLYAHLDRVTIRNPILQGEKIGTVGRTGNVTGAHLHYQQRYRGKGVLPLRFDNRKVRYSHSTPGVKLRSTNCATAPTGRVTAATPGGNRTIAVRGVVRDTDAGRRAVGYRIYLDAVPGTPGSRRVLQARTRADGSFAVTVRSTRTGSVPVYVWGLNAAGTRGTNRVVDAARVTVR